MVKKNRKWIAGVLSLCLIWCVSMPVSVYALTTNLLISSATIHNNGSIVIDPSSSRNIYFIELDNSKSGTITLNLPNSYNRQYVLSNDDIPQNMGIGYTFISSDYHELIGSDTNTINFNNIHYVYISSVGSIDYSITYNTPTPTPTPTDNPIPTPTDTPTPMPTGSGGSGIPLHYLVPFDYYMIAIIILLGGLLICQLFKN